MTKEEKDLLLKDLCARLPYGIKAHYKYYDDFAGETKRLVSEDDTIITGVYTILGNPIKVDGYYVEVEYVKPYLRPMSSMTDDEVRMYHELCEFDDCDYTGRETYFITVEAIDYLASIHVDYRNLIDKGLALKAPEDMYKTE